MKITILIALIFVLSACSLSSQKEEVAVDQDDLEFAVDKLADQPTNTEFTVQEQKVAESVVPEEYQAESVSDEMVMTAPSEPKFEEFKKPEEKMEDKVEEYISKAPMDSPVSVPARVLAQNVDPETKVNSYGPMEKYKVQKGDTLMMVAFKIYGDYRKWKDLKQWNKDQRKITEGVELKYYVPDQKFGWMPSGLPYLVKTGDTLQIISSDKYGTVKKWKSIYDNNRPLIRNPNLIFAGFTLYYVPTRNLASEPK